MFFSKLFCRVTVFIAKYHLTCEILVDSSTFFSKKNFFDISDVRPISMLKPDFVRVREEVFDDSLPSSSHIEISLVILGEGEIEVKTIAKFVVRYYS